MQLQQLCSLQFSDAARTNRMKLVLQRELEQISYIEDIWTQKKDNQHRRSCILISLYTCAYQYTHFHVCQKWHDIFNVTIPQRCVPVALLTCNKVCLSVCLVWTLRSVIKRKDTADSCFVSNLKGTITKLLACHYFCSILKFGSANKGGIFFCSMKGLLDNASAIFHSKGLCECIPVLEANFRNNPASQSVLCSKDVHGQGGYHIFPALKLSSPTIILQWHDFLVQSCFAVVKSCHIYYCSTSPLQARCLRSKKSSFRRIKKVQNALK